MPPTLRGGRSRDVSHDDLCFTHHSCNPAPGLRLGRTEGTRWSWGGPLNIGGGTAPCQKTLGELPYTWRRCLYFISQNMDNAHCLLFGSHCSNVHWILLLGCGHRKRSFKLSLLCDKHSPPPDFFCCIYLLKHLDPTFPLRGHGSQQIKMM